jgi:NTE family protein
LIDAIVMPASPPTSSARATAWWGGMAPSPRRVNLALQGGGAHGAYTWGVLDALLGDPGIEFEGLSGSSAGAMNAVVMAHGWLQRGRDGARQALSDFWTGVGALMPMGMVTQGSGDNISLSPASKMLANWAGWFSPAQINPFDLNPLRDLIARQIDFERLRATSPFKLFVGATQANTGRLRLFREHELTLDMLIASACLPRIHHSVEIEGEPYWDGGYAANPAVFPLFYDCDTSDLLLVLLSPLRREPTPRTVEQIETRITELAFSTTFLREMRMFAQAQQFARPGWLRFGRLERRLQKLRFHLIDPGDLAVMQRTETKLLAHGPFLENLRDQGRQRGADWLAAHGADIGRHATLELGDWLR